MEKNMSCGQKYWAEKEAEEKQTVSESDLKTVVSRISEILNTGFMTCTSKTDGYYGLHIKTETLKSSQELQLLMIKLRQSC